MTRRLLVNIGFGNFVAAGQVVAVISANSAPAKRMRDEAREAGRLVDACQGRRVRSVVVAASGHVILSAIGGEELAAGFDAWPPAPAAGPPEAAGASAAPAGEGPEPERASGPTGPAKPPKRAEAKTPKKAGAPEPEAAKDGRR
jgi:regulator of extracellular matrix RemA (YlzA/DUF370 family)